MFAVSFSQRKKKAKSNLKEMKLNKIKSKEALVGSVMFSMCDVW